MGSDNGFFSTLFAKVMTSLNIQSAKKKGMFDVDKLREQNPELAKKADRLEENAEELKESMDRTEDIIKDL